MTPERRGNAPSLGSVMSTGEPPTDSNGLPFQVGDRMGPTSRMRGRGISIADRDWATVAPAPCQPAATFLEVRSSAAKLRAVGHPSRLIEGRRGQKPTAVPRPCRPNAGRRDSARNTMSSGIPAHRVVRERCSCAISVRFRRSARDSRSRPAVSGPLMPWRLRGPSRNVDTSPPHVDITMSTRRRSDGIPCRLSNDRERRTAATSVWHAQPRYPEDRTSCRPNGNPTSVYRYTDSTATTTVAPVARVRGARAARSTPRTRSTLRARTPQTPGGPTSA